MARKITVDEAQLKFLDKDSYSPAEFWRTPQEVRDEVASDIAVSQGQQPRIGVEAGELLGLLLDEAQAQQAHSGDDLQGVGREAYCRLQKAQEELASVRPLDAVKSALTSAASLVSGMLGGEMDDGPADPLPESGVFDKPLLKNVDLSTAFLGRVKQRREADRLSNNEVGLKSRGPGI